MIKTFKILSEWQFAWMTAFEFSKLNMVNMLVILCFVGPKNKHPILRMLCITFLIQFICIVGRVSQ